MEKQDWDEVRHCSTIHRNGFYCKTGCPFHVDGTQWCFPSVIGSLYEHDEDPDSRTGSLKILNNYNAKILEDHGRTRARARVLVRNQAVRSLLSLKHELHPLPLPHQSQILMVFPRSHDGSI
jgi:hypothetical protein